MSPSQQLMIAVKEIHDIIIHSVPRPISIAKLILQYEIRYTSFIEAYKDEYGKTPDQHRIQTVMEYAQQKIKEGVQIKVVANELGYENTSNFSRTFKNYFGYPPSDPAQL